MLSSPRNRLRSGYSLLALYADSQNWPLAYEAASATVSLIPLLTPRSLEHSDKQHLLNDIIGLASDAAAVALMAKKPVYDALSLLELGRGIITGAVSEMRADISNLQQTNPDFANQYMELCDILNSSNASKINDRYNANQKLEKLINDIRDLPGFDRFLLAPTEEEFQLAAAHGSIAAINVSHYGCHALIIKAEELKVLELPRLQSVEIRNHATAIASPEMLEWLWDAVAEPVLDCLGLTMVPKETWPRVWWIPTGYLAKLPIHAAGYHTNGSSDTVLDRLISSYTSSARMLIHSRQNHPKDMVQRESEKIILLGMEQTPNYKPLPFASREIEAIVSLCDSIQLQVIKPLSYLKQVLSAVQDCKIFHFAGHVITHHPVTHPFIFLSLHNIRRTR